MMRTPRFAGIALLALAFPALALAAALSPERHDYLFFVARGDGTHRFSATLAERAAAMRRARRDN